MKSEKKRSLGDCTAALFSSPEYNKRHSKNICSVETREIMWGDKEKGMEVQGYNEPIPMAIKSEKISGQKNITHSLHNSRHFCHKATRVLKLLKC
jgi:hypothetical protein